MTKIGFAKKHDFKWDPFSMDNLFNGYLVQAATMDTPNAKGKVRSLQQNGSLNQILLQEQQISGDFPGDIVAATELADLQLASGNYTAATEVSKKILAECPTCHSALITLAKGLAGQEQKQAAADAVRQFTRAHPDSAVDQQLLDLMKQFPEQAPTGPLPSAQHQSEPGTHSGF